jgi:Sap, sulfolipid-1-addressing protein
VHGLTTLGALLVIKGIAGLVSCRDSRELPVYAIDVNRLPLAASSGSGDDRPILSEQNAGRTSMGWIDTELALTALAAMMSPTTLMFSVLALMLGDRPPRTGLWFYLGALGATLTIGTVAAFVIGDVASSSTPNNPKPWVAIFDVVAAVAILAIVIVAARRPPNPARIDGMVAQMSKVASAPIVAIVGAGAALANPGGFIPIALKAISETHPTTVQYIVDWLFFALASLLPLALALLLLSVAPRPTTRILSRARDWLERHAKTVFLALLTLLAAALMRNGIAGLTS